MANNSEDRKLVARRKFNLIKDGARAVLKNAHKQNPCWTFIPDKRAMKFIQEDIYKCNLLYAGGIIGELPFQLKECIMHFERFPPPDEHAVAGGSKVRSTPIFSPHKAFKEPIVRALSFEGGKFGSTSALLDAYERAEEYHKTHESHHPDGRGFTSSVWNSFECVFDIMHSLCMKQRPHIAYFKLLEILKHSKFQNLDVEGVYAALIHMQVRGIFYYRGQVLLTNWRRSHMTADNPAQANFDYHMQFLDGTITGHKTNGYLIEVLNHIEAMESEFIRLRRPGTHDRTKLLRHTFLPYAWRWGVWENFSEQEKRSLLTFGRMPPLEGRQTMYSIGKSIGDGIADSEVPSAIEDAVAQGTSRAVPEIRQAIREEAESVITEAQSLIEDGVSRTEAAVEANVARMEGIIGRLTGTLDTLVSSFESIKAYIAGSFEKIRQAIMGIPGMGSLNLSLDSLMNCLRDYILYINVDSQVLKTLLMLSIFRNLGFLDMGYKYFVAIGEYFRGANVGEETSGPWDLISGSLTNMIKCIAAVFASICAGTCLKAEQFWSLVKALSSRLKEIHFIGAGCLGFTRIFDFIGKIYHTVSEWIVVNIFGQKPEQERLAKKITCWVVKVKYFSTEAGLAAIRSNMNMRQTAEKLYPEYLELVAHVRSSDKFRGLLLDLERHKREIRDIYDYITRLETMSAFCPTMFHAQFVGQAGIGKSTLSRSFVRDVSNALWPGERESMYSYNPNLEFFDNYAGQKIFYMDDCFRYQEPKHLTTLIGLVTNTPVILPMANLVDKGTQLTSEIMISSTNTAWPVGKDVLCMNAVHRRRHMLVETVADSRVIDPSTGAFCIVRYKKYYKEEDLPKMPHLKFNLLRPIPQDESSANIQNTSEEQFTLLQGYAEKLKAANVLVSTPGSENLDPSFYFSDSHKPPPPWNLPCEGWTYDQLVHNFVVRFRQFRDQERTYTTQKKFEHSELSIRELETLFNQENDIEGGVELPTSDSSRPFKLIEKWFSYVNAPYGVSDPVGERIASGEGSDLNPELDLVNMDEVVDSIVAGGVETADVEDARRLNAQLSGRARRIRAERPEAIMNALKLIRAPQTTTAVDDINHHPLAGKSYIMLKPNFTRWDGFDSFSGDAKSGLMSTALNWKPLKSYWEVDGFERFFDYLNGSVNKGFRLAAPLWSVQRFKVKNEMFKMLFGAKAYYPKCAEFQVPNSSVPAAIAGSVADVQASGLMAGSKSPFPLYYLQHLVKISGEWCLDVTSLDFCKDWRTSMPQTVPVHRGSDTYSLPLDIAFMFSLMDSFRAFCIEFSELSPDQQDKLVEDAHWRNMYTGLYTLESIRNSCTSSFKKLTIKSLEYLMSPLHFIFNRIPGVLALAGQVAAFVGSLWLLRSLAGLLLGRESETSKYLHRGPQSGIVYHGKLTAQRDEEFYSNLMVRNIRRIVLEDVVGRRIEVQGIHNGKFLIIPKHAILGLEETGDIVVSVGIPGTEDFLPINVPRSHFILSPSSDLCVFTHRELGQTRNIDRLFLSEKEFDESEFSGHFAILGRFKSESLIEVHPYLRRVVKPTLRLQTGEEATIDRALIVKGTTTVGRSGSTVAYTTPQSGLKIAGIQVWSLGTAFSPEIAVQVITSEMFGDMKTKAEAACSDFVSRLVDPDLPGPEKLEGVFTSAEVNQVVGEVPPSELLGKVFKSQFKPTPIASFMDLDKFGSSRCPAALTPFDSRLHSREHPLKHSVGKYSRGTVTTPSTHEFELARDGVTLWIREVLDTQNFEELDYNHVITGSRDDGSSPMNLNSSPGIPFVHKKIKKGKRDFFNINEEGEVDYFDPLVKKDFDRFYQQLTTRQIPLTYAYDFPKDELRPIEKVCGSADTPPKTRSVTCMNMFYLMAWRKNTLRFWDSMHRAADGTFPFCPGINPEGPEWSSAFHYLNKHPNVVDFDVSNWDGFFPPWLFFGGVDVIAEVMSLEEQRRNILLSIGFEVCNSYIQYSRTVYQKFRGMLSGFPGTAEMNSLGHMLLIAYFWFRIVRKHNQESRSAFQTMAAFRRHVSFLVYGDDVIISFSNEVREWFNGETLQGEYQALGYPVTDGSKNLVVSKWKTLAEATFLKSTWRSCFHHVYIRKMDISVAYDLLYWVRAKNDPSGQFCNNVIDALRIAFGHGRSEYNVFVKRLMRWLKQADISLPLYSYREIMLDHISRYYGVEYENTNIYNYS